MTFKRFKKVELPCNIGSVVLVITGTIVGSVTLNPAILASITGAGVLLKTYTEYKNFKRKIEMCKFANTTYDKVLTDIRSYMRGMEYDKEKLLDYLKVIDDIVIDMTPLTDKYERKYNMLFIE